MVKEEFNKQNPKLTPSMPRFAGKATWATALKRRVEAPMKVRGGTVFDANCRPCSNSCCDFGVQLIGFTLQ